MAEQDATTNVGKPVITKNPYFRGAERAPYKLAYLLRELPRHIIPESKYPENVYLMADAARQHASNSIETVMHGLDEIGNLMIGAGLGEEYEASGSRLTGLGALVSHLVCELQMLMEIEDSMQHAVESRPDHLART